MLILCIARSGGQKLASARQKNHQNWIESDRDETGTNRGRSRVGSITTWTGSARLVNSPRTVTSKPARAYRDPACKAPNYFLIYSQININVHTFKSKKRAHTCYVLLRAIKQMLKGEEKKYLNYLNECVISICKRKSMEYLYINVA